jgi:hypothetical protein
MFCKHDWKILSEVTTKSRLEILAECTEKGQIDSFPSTYCTRKLIQIVTCSKCGKLKRFVEKI